MRNHIHVPGARITRKVFSSLSRTEKIFFYILFSIVVATTFIQLMRINNIFLVEVPVRDGVIVEGVVGITPPRLNPIAVSPFTSPGVENDLITLVYSGLMRATPEGSYIPDLAKDYTISDDGLTYTFTLKDNLVWHDNEPVTSADVIFTIQKAQDPDVQSRHKASWDGVIAEAPDEKTVVFTLSEPYAPFIQNTTLGVIPKHVWENIHPEEYSKETINIDIVGTGPYKIKGMQRNKNNTVEHYELTSFEHYALGEPYIKDIVIQFYANEQSLIDAYRNGDVTSIHSISPEIAEMFQNEGYRIEQAYLPRIFGAFFNQNQAQILARNEVREALNIAVDRDLIITNVLHGFATAIDGPIPPGSLGYMPHTESTSTPEEKVQQARAILKNAGWEEGSDGVLERELSDGTARLAFSITTTTEAPELVETAELLKGMWESMGADVEIITYETRDNLENFAIRPREYDVLLFGTIIGRDSDPYAFWHSSQRLDPGLNIASYANITVDAALERARSASTTSSRIKQYQIFQEEVQHDRPAVFLYTPHLIYLTNDSVKGMNLIGVNTPSERFLDIYSWYIRTEYVWEIFAQHK
jgi:peptide/nickel transport system substrate-binding protein